MLARPYDHISVASIINAVDDPAPRLDVIDPVTANARELTDIMWQTIGDIIARFMETVTLADVSHGLLGLKSDDKPLAA